MNCDFASISVDSQFSTLGWPVSNKFDSVACGCPILCSVKIGLPFLCKLSVLKLDIAVYSTFQGLAHKLLLSWQVSIA